MSTAASVRIELLHRLKELGSRARRIEDHQHERDREVPADWDDLAKHREDDEVVAQLDDMTREEALRIIATLRLMDTGGWGTCASCRKAIEPARLEAQPTSTTCIACAQAAEGVSLRPGA